MQKAMFFEEAYNQGILPNISEGYIFSLTSPDVTDVNRKSDPFLLQMVSYIGLKSIMPMGDGVRFQAEGKNMYCMLEPSNFSMKHVEPASRSSNTTAHMPYRFADCDMFFTKDNKFRVLMAKEAHHLFDSFTINFPAKGDIGVLYFVFDKENHDTVVMQFMEENVAFILKAHLRLREHDAKTIAKKFIDVVRQFRL